MATYTSQHDGRWIDPATWTANKISSPTNFTTGWATDGVTVTSNLISNPYDVAAALTADLLTETAVNGLHNVYIPVTLTDNTISTIVVFMKKGDRNIVYVGLQDKSNIDNIAYFDLNSGVVGSKTVGVISSSISDEGSSWYRCEMTVNCLSGATQPYTFFGSAISDGTITYTGDITKRSLYGWCVVQWEGTASYPSIAGDVINIGITADQQHTVIYDNSNTAEMGVITVGATTGTLYSTLKASRLKSTKLTMSHNNIVINAKGSWDWGTVADPIPYSYLAEVYWNTTADGAKGLNVTALGKLYIADDPTFYGSDYDTTLYANWASGRDLTVNGDFTAKWDKEILGAELLTNRTFDDATWSGSDPNKTVSSWTKGFTSDANNYITNTGASNQIKIVKASAVGIYVSQFALTIGKLYKYSVDIVSVTGTAQIGTADGLLHTYTTTGTKTGYFIASGAVNFIIGCNQNNTTVVFDNASLKEVISGREILVHKYALYSSNTTDVQRYSIHSMSYDGTKTTITIGENAPSVTFNQGGFVLNPNRNVILGKLSYSKIMTANNTNRPIFNIFTDYSNPNHSIGGSFGGIYYISVSNRPTLGSGFVGRNSNILLYSCSYVDLIQGLIFSNNCGLSDMKGTYLNTLKNNTLYVFSTGGSGALTSCDNVQLGTGTNIFSNIYAILGGTGGFVCKGNIFGNSIGIYNSSQNVLTGRMWHNTTAVYKATGSKMVGGKMGYDVNDNVKNNTIDVDFRGKGIPFEYNNRSDFVFINSHVTTDPWTIYQNRQFTAFPFGKINFENFNQTIGDHRCYQAFGLTKRDATILNPGGASSSIYAQTLSNTGTVNYIQALGTWVEDNVPTSLQTRSVKISRNSTNVVVNGTFSTDTDWTKGTGWSISGNKANYNGTGSTLLDQINGYVTSGRIHTITFTISNWVSGNIRPYLGGSGAGTPVSGNGTYTQTFLAVGTSRIMFQSGATAGNFSIDDVSVSDSTFPTNTELYLEVEYLTGSGITTSRVNSTSTLSENNIWLNFPVTFTPEVVGKVIYRVYLKQYTTSTTSINIDNMLYRGFLPPIPATWFEGESNLSVDYTSEQNHVKDKMAIRNVRKIYG